MASTVGLFDPCDDYKVTKGQPWRVNIIEGCDNCAKNIDATYACERFRERWMQTFGDITTEARRSNDHVDS